MEGSKEGDFLADLDGPADLAPGEGEAGVGAGEGEDSEVAVGSKRVKHEQTVKGEDGDTPAQVEVGGK